VRLRIARKARRELDEIFAYWAARAGVEVADRLVDAIAEHFSLLLEFPGIGRRCEDIAPAVRCFPAGKYLVYYRKARGWVEILHVFHGARDQAAAVRGS